MLHFEITAYRDSEPLELCRDCKEPAESSCRRCRRPGCAEHAPRQLGLCADCAAMWQEHREAIDGRYWAAIGPVAIWAVFVLPLMPLARWLIIRRRFRRFVDQYQAVST